MGDSFSDVGKPPYASVKKGAVGVGYHAPNDEGLLSIHHQPVNYQV